MMISDFEALKIAEKIENANNIDIKETIEKATTAGYLGEKHFYCTVIEDGGMTHTVPEILGDRYKSQPLDNLYYDIISKALDHDGIYISLGYCASNLNIPDEDIIGAESIYKILKENLKILKESGNDDK